MNGCGIMNIGKLINDYEGLSNLETTLRDMLAYNESLLATNYNRKTLLLYRNYLLLSHHVSDMRETLGTLIEIAKTELYYE